MTQEQKQILLVDLCGRLCYGVVCYAPDDEYGENGILYSVAPFEKDEPNIWIEYSTGNILSLFISEIKPYLRPLSSMSEEERIEYNIIKCSICPDEPDDYAGFIEWLNEHHFDYRGLIEKCLALEATEDMYK